MAITINALPEPDCPDPADTGVLCGVSQEDAQVNTNQEFSDWLDLFDYDSNLYSVEISYAYEIRSVVDNSVLPPNPNQVNGQAPLNPVPGQLVIVSVTWTLTDKDTGCIGSCPSTFTLANGCRIDCSEEKDDVLCKGASTGSITVSANGGTLPYEVKLYKLDDPVSPYRIASGLDTNPIEVLFDNLPAGSYSYLVTDDSGISECTNNEPILISEPLDDLSLDLSSDPENCEGTNSGSVEVIFSGGTPPYDISIDGNAAIVDATSPYTFPNLGTGIHSVSIVDANGCRDGERIFVDLIICSDAHCTYTQGYYGELNGSACTIDGTPTYDHQIMITAIDQAGGVFDFGSGLNVFRLKASDIYGAGDPTANNIFKMLPGGKTPRALDGFDTYDNLPLGSGSDWLIDGDPLAKNGPGMGSINNNLLSQTMTLFFNFAADPTLGNFVLEPKFATSDVACGSTDIIPNTYHEFTISSTVINYLNENLINYPGGATVTNLFKLANRALGAENIGGLTHSNINGAVDAINRGFDGCRIRVPLVVIIIKPVGDPIDASKVNVNNEPIFTAYPIPFNDVIKIRYDFDYQSDVQIQILDTKGTLLMTQDDADAYQNKEVIITPSFKKGKNQLFFVKVITNKGVSIRKVLSNEY